MLQKSNDNDNRHPLEDNFEVLESELLTVENGRSTACVPKAIKAVIRKSC